MLHVLQPERIFVLEVGNFTIVLRGRFGGQMGQDVVFQLELKHHFVAELEHICFCVQSMF